MTEVPEHLLRRSRERKAALGGAPAGGDAPAPAAEAAPPPAAEAPAEVAAAPEAAAPAPVEEPVAAAVAAPPVRRLAVPVWVMPVLLALPIWALVYAYALDSGGGATALTPLELGARVYESNCASCHLDDGAGDAAGGVGRQLNDGEVELTFPDRAGHVAIVREGSPPPGTPYGDPDRPGGQRVARGGMPPWAGQLTDEEIEAVVTYEREGLR